MNIDHEIKAAHNVSLITPDRLKRLCQSAMSTSLLEGDMAEFGVYRGGSAKCLSACCPGKILHLFDTYNGLPHTEDSTRDNLGLCVTGRFVTKEDDVKKHLDGLPVLFHTGIFPDTTRKLLNLSFSFVHVDCDLYKSCLDAIEFFWPRIVSGGKMLFDDFNCSFTGVTQAVRDNFSVEEIVEYEIGCVITKMESCREPY